MDFAVLGPMRITGDSGPIEVAGAKERTVLAHLISAVQQTVPADDLIDSLWGDTPPRSAVKTLQTYILRIRNSLEPQRSGQPSLVLTDGRGYRLDVDPLTIDATRFVRLADLGHQALQRGNPAEAHRTLTEAGALWRGAAYTGFENTVFAELAARRLDEIRVTAAEDRLAAELDMGAASSTISELDRLVHAEPYRERLWMLLIQALYNDGRQAAALTTYDRVRTILNSDLGIDPGPQLQHIHQQVLTQDPALERRGGARATALFAAGRLYDHPLVGRAVELEWLRARWARARRGEPVSAVITGRRGAGASRLLYEFAAEVAVDGVCVVPAGRRPVDGPALIVADHEWAPVPADGQLVVTLRGSDWPVPPGADELRLPPLEQSDIQQIVAAYVEPAHLTSATRAVLAESGGWPGPAHTAAVEWKRRVATRQVLAARGAAEGAAHDLAHARADLTDGLLVLQTPVQPNVGQTACPWQGLAAYGPAQAEFYCGRERVVAELLARVASSRLVAIVGASGSGKSSLLGAGLLASMADGVFPDSAKWRVLAMRPGEHPLRELAQRAIRIPDAVPEVGDVLTQLIRDEDPEQSVTVLAIDQFEEVWTAGATDGERAGFLDVISELVSTEQTSVRVVMCLRADYLTALTEHPGLAEIVADHLLLVGPPTADETRRAIELPAARAGLHADIGLFDAIVTDAGEEPGLLPLLSTAMTRLWHAREGNRLTFAAYLAGGSLTGAIAGLAEDAYSALPTDDQATARTLLMRLSGPGDGTAATRRRVRSAELKALPISNISAVVDGLAAARLLTVSDGYVEVAHEALFQDWPRLRSWLAEDAASRELQRRLAIAAAEWDADGREAFQLWRGTRLEAGLDYAHTHPQEITMTEKSFLAQSHEQVDAIRLEAEQKATDTIRQNRRLRGLLGGVVLVAVAAMVAGVLAVASRQRAVTSEQQTQRVQADAEAAAVTAEAGRLAAAAANNPQLDLALLTAVEAVKTAPTALTYGALLGVLFRSPEVVTQFRQFNLAGPIAVSRDGSTVYVATSSSVQAIDSVSGSLGATFATGGALTSIAGNPTDNRILIVKGDGGEQVSVLQADGTTQWSLSVAALAEATGVEPGSSGMHALWLSDGTVLIAQDGRLVLVDGSTGAVLSVVPVPGTGAVDRLVPLPDGRISLAIASRAHVFDPVSRTVVPFDVPGIVAAAASSGTLAVVSNQNLDAPTVTLYDAVTLQPTGSGFTPSSLSGIAFSADGSTLANGNEDRVELRDGRTGALRRQLVGHTGSVVDLTFAPSGMLWSSGRDATAIGWDPDGNPGFFETGSGTPTGDFGHNAAANEIGLAYTSQSGSDVPFTLIDPRTGLALGDPLPQPACTARNADCWEVDGAITPDGTTAVGLRNEDADARVMVWNTADRSLRASFPVGVGGSAIDVTPDGKYAVVNSATTAGVMDLSTGEVRFSDREHVLDGRSGIEGEVAISPDGRTAAIGIKDGVRLLDLPSGTVRTESTVAEGARVAAMAWTPDSAHIMAGSSTGYLYVLDAVDLHQVAARQLITEGRIGSVVISPTTPWAATMGGSGELTLWDTTSWQPVGGPIAPGARGWLGFDPDGATLRIMRSSGAASAMTTDPASWLRTACQVANRDLTEAEWASIRPGKPLESTCAGLR